MTNTTRTPYDSRTLPSTALAHGGNPKAARRNKTISAGKTKASNR